MADPAQTARATALEIPVMVQGSKTVEGSERRELFTETTKTILVSKNGAVLQLSAKVSPGQCVFLRNDQSGSEILCRVLESRQAGYTDLEFTSYNPKFWDDGSQRPAPAVGQQPAQKGLETAVATSALPPATESGAPTSEVPAAEEVPLAVLETSTKAPANSSSETTEELPKQSNSADQRDAKDAVPDWDAAKDAELLAVLAAMDRDSKAHRGSPAKETKKTKDVPQATATANEPEQGKTTSKAASDTTGVSSTKPRIHGIRKFTARRDPVSIAIAASILIAVVLGITCRTKIGSWIHKNDRPASAHSARPSRSAAQQSQLPASTVLNVNSSAAAFSQPAPTEAPKPGVAAAQSALLPAADAGGTRTDKGVDDPTASAAAKVASTSSSGSSGPAVIRHASHRKPKGMNAPGIIPPKIVSQAAPSVPPWAKGLDVDLVVQLNALIDEKGNLVETTPVSGPRLLQPAAQRAVALWVFEPALSNGKPIAWHMLLTVQFQK